MGIRIEEGAAVATRGCMTAVNLWGLSMEVKIAIKRMTRQVNAEKNLAVFRRVFPRSAHPFL
jgi:hypothetical protein